MLGELRQTTSRRGVRSDMFDKSSCTGADFEPRLGLLRVGDSAGVMGVTRLAVDDDVDGVVKPISAPSWMYPSNFALVSRLRRLGVHAGAERNEDVEPRDIVLDIADVEDPLDKELDVLVVLFRLEPRRGRSHAVGGADEGRAFGSTPNSSVPLLETCPPLYERDMELRLREDIADARFWREPVDICRTKGDGASSSSLSLHPRPVVRPMPPRSSLPSR